MAKEPDTSTKTPAQHAARGYPFKSSAAAQAHVDAREANRSAEAERVARAKAREKRDAAIIKRNALKGT